MFVVALTEPHTWPSLLPPGLFFFFFFPQSVGALGAVVVALIPRALSELGREE